MAITSEELLKKALDYNGIVVVLIWASSTWALFALDKFGPEHYVTICGAILAQGWLTKVNTKSVT